MWILFNYSHILLWQTITGKFRRTIRKYSISLESRGHSDANRIRTATLHASVIESITISQIYPGSLKNISTFSLPSSFQCINPLDTVNFIRTIYFVWRFPNISHLGSFNSPIRRGLNTKRARFDTVLAPQLVSRVAAKRCATRAFRCLHKVAQIDSGTGVVSDTPNEVRNVVRTELCGMRYILPHIDYKRKSQTVSRILNARVDVFLPPFEQKCHVPITTL